MNTIRFSICKDRNDPIEPFEAVVASFSKGHSSPVQLHSIPWDNYKQEVTAMALYGQGVDVSQVGAPVINDLVAMNALRPFTQREIGSFGGPSAFAPVAWNKMLSTDEVSAYAMPWIVDPRAMIYWRDMFEDAGVDETTTFTSFDAMEQGFERLQGAGFQTPWAVGTADKLNAFQVACTWIWGLGGEIGRDDKILFDHPETIEALTRYFNLYRFMPQAGQNPDAREIGNWFLQRKVAAMIGSPSAILQIYPEISSKVGVALAPGPTYVGGSSLIIWKNSHYPDDAVALVRHLTSHEAQLEYARRAGFLPARTSALNDEYFSGDPFLNVFAQSVLRGRTYVNLRLSGLMEDMLANAISHVWSKIIADPLMDVKTALKAELEPIARRFSLWAE
jgi:multiple sugar transport system substrate-binding protein